MNAKSQVNREQWLNRATGMLAFDFAKVGAAIPLVKVSTGFGGSNRNKLKVLGVCWNGAAADDGAAQVFISPIVSDSLVALATLTHELIHACHPGAGHRGKFRKTALALGLTGKMTATVAGPDLTAKLQSIVTAIGPYPHAKLNPGLSGIKKQSTRLILCECEPCGYKARVSNGTIEAMGAPLCGSCLERMEVK